MTAAHRDYAAENAIIRRNFELYDVMVACANYKNSARYPPSDGQWKLYFAAQDMWHKLARDPQTGEWWHR